MSLKSGFMGSCLIDDIYVRCTSFSVNVKQEPQFHDHILGLRDSIPSGLDTKKDNGHLNLQKYFWRPGVKTVSGNITFPATIKGLQKTFNLVKFGDDFDMEFVYSCQDIKRVCTNCKINSFTFTANAGEILTVSIDIVATYMEEFASSTYYHDISSEKLITWDQFLISSKDFENVNITSNKMQSFTFTVNNNCMPIYTAGNNYSNDLFPSKIRVGIQEVTGTSVYYVKGIPYIGLDANTDSSTIDMNISDSCLGEFFYETLTVIYKPIERSSAIQTLFHTLPFVGVGRALGGRTPVVVINISVPETSDDGNYTVSWEYDESEIQQISSFVLEEYDGSYVEIATVDNLITSYNIYDKLSGTYRYRIKAVSVYGESEYIYSNEIIVSI